MDIRPYTAEFKLVRDAKAFTARISEGGYWAETIEQRGKVVTWEYDADAHPDTPHSQYLMDMLETVGFYGSAPTGRKATLNGIVAPASY